MQYRDLPSVESILSTRSIRALNSEYSREWLTTLVREEIDRVRKSISEVDGNRGQPITPERITEQVAARVERLGKVNPVPVINATGVIIHTNLGRAPLSLESMEAVLQASEGYSNLELNLDDGRRGRQTSPRSASSQAPYRGGSGHSRQQQRLGGPSGVVGVGNGQRGYRLPRGRG